MAARTALIVVDVQNDFCEGGALGVTGGHDIADRVAQVLATPGDYDFVVASQDWHTPGSDNGGHFADEPNFVTTWPTHCVADTHGAKLHASLDGVMFDSIVRKGMNAPAYSAFEGTDVASGTDLVAVLSAAQITNVDVVGLATDHCVKATAMDAAAAGFQTRVLEDLCAGVHPNTVATALMHMRDRNIRITTTRHVDVDRGSMKFGP